MSAPFVNIYNLRRVAETAAKACDICYKPTTCVLITPDNKDFFYVCAVHLKDKHFCSPKIDHEAIKAKREQALEEEKEKLKKEYEEKKKKKKEKEDKKKQKDDDKKDDKKDDKDKDKKDDKDKDKDDNDDKDSDESDTIPEEEPRVFELKAAFYQQRLQRKRQQEAAKRDRERISQPGYFPSVPSELPSKK